MQIPGRPSGFSQVQAFREFVLMAAIGVMIAAFGVLRTILLVGLVFALALRSPQLLRYGGS